MLTIKGTLPLWPTVIKYRPDEGISWISRKCSNFDKLIMYVHRFLCQLWDGIDKSIVIFEDSHIRIREF